METLDVRPARSAVMEGGRYSDRIRTPSETLALMRRYFDRLGITRVARQTDLDRIGIPCYSAMRPNGRTLSVSQGKGIDDASAAASAVMEAAEFAIAEAPLCRIAKGTPRALTANGLRVYSVARQLPATETLDPDLPIAWVKGRSVLDSLSVYVPLDAVTIGGGSKRRMHMSRSTNGLASGNCSDEAVLHGLCELIERDASTLSALRPALQTPIDPHSFHDPVVEELTAKIERAGMHLRLFNQTSDIGVPVVLATIFDPDGQRAYFDLASGVGCHPVAARAAIRAITEAAQTRVTNIAGARDDFDPGEYRERLSTSAPEHSARPLQLGAAPRDLPSDRSLPAMVATVVAALSRSGVDEIIAVPLCRERGFSVVRMMAPMLEDRGPNTNWRPGRRAVRALLDKP